MQVITHIEAINNLHHIYKNRTYTRQPSPWQLSCKSCKSTNDNKCSSTNNQECQTVNILDRGPTVNQCSKRIMDCRVRPVVLPPPPIRFLGRLFSLQVNFVLPVASFAALLSPSIVHGGEQSDRNWEVDSATCHGPSVQREGHEPPTEGLYATEVPRLGPSPTRTRAYHVSTEANLASILQEGLRTKYGGIAGAGMSRALSQTTLSQEPFLQSCRDKVHYFLDRPKWQELCILIWPLKRQNEVIVILHLQLTDEEHRRAGPRADPDHSADFGRPHFTTVDIGPESILGWEIETEPGVLHPGPGCCHGPRSNDEVSSSLNSSFLKQTSDVDVNMRRTAVVDVVHEPDLHDTSGAHDTSAGSGEGHFPDARVGSRWRSRWCARRTLLSGSSMQQKCGGIGEKFMQRLVERGRGLFAGKRKRGSEDAVVG